MPPPPPTDPAKLSAYLRKKYGDASAGPNPRRRPTNSLQQQQQQQHPTNDSPAAPGSPSSSRRLRHDSDDSDDHDDLDSWDLKEKRRDTTGKNKKRSRSQSPDQQSPSRRHTVHRDKLGRIVDDSMPVDHRELRKQRRVENKRKDADWAAGTVQKNEIIATHGRSEDGLAIQLSRTVDDKDLNEFQRQKVHWGDPTLSFGSNCTQLKVSKKSQNSYKGSWPPNRFNVAPGFRWDGVNRSNGFEDEYFLQINEKMATQEIAYKWSTEDM